MEKAKSLNGSKLLIILCAALLVFVFVAAFASTGTEASILDVNVVFDTGNDVSGVSFTVPDGKDTTKDNEDYVLPSDPSAVGYVFLGWDYTGRETNDAYLKAGDTLKVQSTNHETIDTKETLTFTAVWGVKVTYDKNMSDATVTVTSDPTDLFTAGDTAKLKIAYTTAKALTAADYTFVGWSKNADTAADDKTIIKAEADIPAEEVTSDFTLYAIWKANFLKVTYHANTGAETTDADVTVPLDLNHYKANDLVTVLGASTTNTVNSTSTLSTQAADTTTTTDTTTDATTDTTATTSATETYTDAVMTRTGYTFAGWATSADSTVVAYKPGATFTVTAATDLYAVWTSGTTSETTTTTPQTGAEDNLLLYSVVALIALMGIVYLCLDRRKVKAKK